MKKDNKSSASGLYDREASQKSEGYKEVSSSIPDDRIQSTKQVLNATELGVDRATYNGAVAPSRDTTLAKTAKEIQSKVRVRPDASVDVLDGKQVGGVPLSGGMMVRSPAGVGEVSPANDISRSPYSCGGYRPATRYGKKVADLNFEINNTISEQVITKFDESKDLRESPDSVQGYNGRKQFKQARGKKNAGNRPQDLLFDRSTDIITHDEIVYTDGQILDGIPSQYNYPTRSYVGIGVEGADVNGYTDVACPMEKGNYSLDGFSFTTDDDGLISSINFTESRFNTRTSRMERDAANMNWQVDGNNLTQSMVRLQTQLGRETTDKWSPLGYTIEQGYQVNALYHDMELSLAAVSAMAYRAAVSSLSYQINLTGKDGAQTNAPAFASMMQGIGTCPNSQIYSNLGVQDTFNSAMYNNGSASAMIAAFDSTGKYASKADVLTQQRSLKLHLSQADNNMNPFHCKPEFMKAVNTAHTFSSEDGSYNPMLPIYATNTIRLINPLSFNYFLEGWKNPKASDFDSSTNDPVTGTAARYNYAYNDLRRISYVMPIKHPLVEGICRWLMNHERDIAKVYGRNAVVNMPATFNMLYPSMFQFIVCSAMQDIAYCRNQYFKDIIFAGEQSTYIWDDLKPLSELNPLWSDQLTIGSYDQALKIGRLNTAAKIRTFWPEHWTVLGEQVGEGADYLAPWYFNERQFNPCATADDDTFLDTDNAYCMTMPCIRNGVRHDYVDLLYSVSERDVRLSLDKMVTIPYYTEKTNYNSNAPLAACVYVPRGGSYTPDVSRNCQIHINACRYDANSDGRVEVTYDENINENALLCVPREMGWLAPGIAGGTPMITSVGSSGDVSITFDAMHARPIEDGPGWLVPYGNVLSGSTSWCVTSYQADGYNGGRVGQSAIDITAALKQKYWRCFAARDIASVTANAAYLTAMGFVPTISSLFSTAATPTVNTGVATVRALYALNSTEDPVGTQTISNTFITTVSALWSVLNRVFFADNPFEDCLVPTESCDPKAGVIIDPLENAFIFGLAGTLASDYNQDILERLNIFDQLGLNYLEDEFTKNSLIFHA